MNALLGFQMMKSAAKGRTPSSYYEQYDLKRRMDTAPYLPTAQNMPRVGLVPL